MEITKNLETLLIRKFGFGEVEKIAESIIERMEAPTEEDLQQAIDDSLIYYDDQWEIMKYYQNPKEANFNEAMMEFYDDLLEILYILYKVNA